MQIFKNIVPLLIHKIFLCWFYHYFNLVATQNVKEIMILKDYLRV